MTAKTETTETTETNAKELPTPTQFQVVVTNTVNNVTGELFAKECEWGKRGSMMKGVRQRIRDMGASITKAEVTFNNDKSHQTIAFTDLVVTEKVKPAGTGRAKSSAQKNAADTVATEIDQEIVGIAADMELQLEARTEALKKYSRHQLIHAANTVFEAGLSHYAKKADALNFLTDQS